MWRQAGVLLVGVLCAAGVWLAVPAVAVPGVPAGAGLRLDVSCRVTGAGGRVARVLVVNDSGERVSPWFGPVRVRGVSARSGTVMVRVGLSAYRLGPGEGVVEVHGFPVRLGSCTARAR